MYWLIIYWLAFGILVYVYAGYPLGMQLLSRLLGRSVSKGSLLCSVTVIVSAYNEERGIREKLRNLMALDYPPHLLNVIVVSDGSTDGTDQAVTQFGDPRVALMRVEGRVGKTACQNQAAASSVGEIVLFTDATTIIDAGAIRMLVQNFHDPEVGCVAARLVYVGKGQNVTAVGGTAYWNYEIALRLAESRLGSLIGASGCLYAVRRSAYRPIRPDLISDFVIAMQMEDQSLRTVLEPGALCFEDTLDRSSQELSMRIRVAIRSVAALVSERRFLNPFTHGTFAIQVISHKVLRYLAPYIWIVMLASNIMLLSRPLYAAMFGAQLVLLAAGAAGFVLQSRGANKGVLSKPYYFLLTNIASLLAVLRYLRGERVKIWNPVRS